VGGLLLSGNPLSLSKGAKALPTMEVEMLVKKKVAELKAKESL
jgi:hypothetical protein